LAILACTASSTYAERLVTRVEKDLSTSAPISISPDQNWDGIDGAWSTFTLRVGNPAQNVRTLVSTAGYQTWVVLPQGCQAAGSHTACAESRGWLFNSNASTTFDEIGLYTFSIEKNLGYSGNAVYGHDTVRLGGQGEGGPTLKNTTIGTFAVEDFYLGLFGVNPKSTNFTDFNTQIPSYMALLKDEDLIPSVSFGYTAGAKYRSTGVLASLTLGGYDSSRFVENESEWTLAADNERDIVVVIQSINTPSDIISSPVATELLPKPIYAYIDSTVPQIWLPKESCEVFEYEFGLIYDNGTNLYLVNETLHQSLLERDASITFVLGQELTGGETVRITLPYAAFDLTAKPPYMGLANDTRYFPLRQAQNDTQYTLGRTFLQEAYLSVNWETARFNVSQVSWDSPAEQDLVAMVSSSAAEKSPPSISSSAASVGSGLSTGAKVGVSIAVFSSVAIIVLLGVFLVRRHRRKAAIRHQHLADSSDDEKKTGQHQTPSFYGGGVLSLKAELDGNSTPEQRLHSAPGTDLAISLVSTPTSPGYYLSGAQGGAPASPSTPSAGEGTHSSHTGTATLFSPVSAMSEADGRERQIYEMPGDMPIVREKDGKSLSEKEAVAWRQKVYNGVDISVVPEETIGRQESDDNSKGRKQTVDPGEVVEMERKMRTEREKTVHRAFSFEMDDSDREPHG
jgi:hypothetical protein